MNSIEIVLKPIGIVRSEIKEQSHRPDGIPFKEKLKHIKNERDRARTLISEIEINPELTELLDGIEGYSHLMILYWAHKVPEGHRKLTKVHPMGLKEIPQKGVFATCSPARPNPILLTAVKLISKHGNILKVQGLDAIDGSPVIDIKPYVQSYHGAENPQRPQWIEDIHQQIDHEGDMS